MWQKLLKLFFLFTILLTACGGRENNETGNGVNPTAELPDKSPAVEQSNELPQVQEDQREVTTVRFLTDSWSETNYYADLIDTFIAENPDIQIEVVTFDDILGDEPLAGVELIASFASAADVIDNVASPEAVASGLVLDLTPLFEEANLAREDFYPGTLATAQWGGGTWYLPVSLTSTAIFYNKDLFDTAGLPYPEAGWSWDEFLITAKALTLPDDAGEQQWGFVEPTFSNPVSLIESRVGALLDPTTESPMIRFEDTAVIEAVRWYTELYSVHEVAPFFPSPELGKPAQASILIQEGKAGMWVEPLANWSAWNERTQLNVGVVPFPLDAPGAPATPVQVSGYFVSAGTDKIDAAWRWLLFLSENVPSNEEALFGGRGLLPARRSIAEAIGFWERIDEAIAPTLNYSLENAYIAPITTHPRTAERYLRDVITAVLVERQPVEVALSAAQQVAEADFAELAAEVTPAEGVVVAPVTEASAFGEGVRVIHFLTAGSPLEQEIYQRLATEFQASRPDIAVQIRLPESVDGSFTFHSFASQADCFQWSSQFNETDLAAVISLDPLLDADPTRTTSDFFSSAVEPFSYEGQLWGLPAQVGVGVMAFNKTLFDVAGIPYPEPDWTTEEMLDTAVTLTIGQAEETKQYGYLPGSFAAQNVSIFLDLLGAQIVDEEQEPPALSLDQATTLAALRWYASLATELGVMPLLVVNDPGSWQPQRAELIEGSRAAMWLASDFDLVGTDDSLDIGYAPLPVAENGRRSYQAATAYFISAETRLVQPCWEWINFLVEQPVIGERNFTIPALRAAAESTAYRQTVGVERAAANLNTVSEALQPPLLLRFSGETSWLTTAYWWLADAYEQILIEGMSAADALTDAQAKADAFRACLITNNNFAADGREGCLREVDEALALFLYGSNGE